MAIGGINNGMGYYNYQASVNNMRLAQALSRNNRYMQAVSGVSSVPSVSSRRTSMASSLNFVKSYNSSMSDLMNAANKLKDSNQNGVMNQLGVTSSDTSIATADAKFPVKNKQAVELDVQQIAQAQVNVSDGVKASAKADTDMDFTVKGVNGSVDVKVSALDSKGIAKSNAQMLKEAAEQINKSDSDVKASVVQKDGVASLQIEGKTTGASNTFEVSGQLGAAAGAENVKTEAANAKYSVTKNGETTNHESYTNDVSLDYTRIGVKLKGVGKTTIKADVDTDKVASAVGDLVKSYNSSLKLLNDNYDRGTGVDRQLRNLVAGLGSEKSLEKLGITVNKDATLSFDKSVFAENMKKDPSLTKSLVSGVSGIAEKAYSKASAGMNISSSSLLNGDIANATSNSATNPYNVFGMYSRSGAYNMSNYYAVGMMMNYLI